MNNQIMQTSINHSIREGHEMISDLEDIVLPHLASLEPNKDITEERIARCENQICAAIENTQYIIDSLIDKVCVEVGNSIFSGNHTIALETVVFWNDNGDSTKIIAENLGIDEEIVGELLDEAATLAKENNANDYDFFCGNLARTR